MRKFGYSVSRSFGGRHLGEFSYGKWMASSTGVTIRFARSPSSRVLAPRLLTDSTRGPFQ